MNEENTLALNIQAKILPEVEGAQQFEQQLQNLPQNIQQRMGEVASSPGFTQGLSEKDAAKVQRFATTDDMLEMQRFQEIQKDMLEDMEIDISAGRLTLSQERKYIKKLGRQKQEVDKLSESMIENLESDYFSFLGPDRKEVLKRSILEGADEAKQQLDQLVEKFRDLRETVNTTNKETQSFFDQLQKAGVFAVGGMIVNEGMKWARTGAEIEAREMTSFDLTSPIGMYREQRMMDVFRETRERERLFGLGGTVIGAAAGFMVGGPLGAVAGGLAGGSFGSGIAGLLNIATEAEAQEELKILQQGYGTLSGYVVGTQGYDVARARARAGYGSGILGSVGLGYTPEQELQMRTMFGGARGMFDADLYGEQTTFARALGLDPGQLYQLNVSGRVTGADLGIGGLHQARQLTSSIFGENASPQRIVDILNEIKNINEQQLRFNIDADAGRSLSFAQLPSLIFGTDNPYGRLGDLGGQTLQLMQGMMNPRSQAHEAFLFQALGQNDVMGFTEAMKGGMFSGDNLNNVMRMVQRMSGGNRQMAYFMLNEMMPGAPKGFIPGMTDLVTDADRMNEFINRNVEGLSDGDQERLLSSYGVDAQGAISQTERANAEVSRLRISAAEQWRKTINDASIRMAEFWDTMGSNAKLHQELLDKQEEGFKKIDQWRYGKKYFTEEEEEEGERFRNRGEGRSPGGAYSPHRENRNMTPEDVRKFQDAVESFQDSVDKLKEIKITVSGDSTHLSNSVMGL